MAPRLAGINQNADSIEVDGGVRVRLQDRGWRHRRDAVDAGLTTGAFRASSGGGRSRSTGPVRKGQRHRPGNADEHSHFELLEILGL
jgi:hypothetical protein